MRMLALVTDAFGGRGGIAQYNRDLLQAVGRQPERLSIEVLPRLAPDAYGPLPSGVRQHGGVLGRAAFAWKSLRLALRTRPDLVFCGHLYMAPLAALLARLCGSQLIVQLHGVEAWTRPSKVQRQAVEAADLVLCVSRDTRARTLTWADIAPEKVVVAPNTVAPAFSPADPAEARRRLGLGGETVLLSVGRLDARERYKGHDRVIQALQKAVGDDVLYLVAGEGDDRPRLEALARECGVAANVRFLGRVEPNALPDLYRAADLFVLPSTGEGFGIVYLEAMACGTPALGLAAAGAVDALGDGDLGLAVDEADFAAVLRQFISECRGASRSVADRIALAQRTRARFATDAFNAFLMAVIAQLA